MIRATFRPDRRLGITVAVAAIADALVACGGGAAPIEAGTQSESSTPNGSPANPNHKVSCVGDH
jgi:hypothetical protein